VQTALCCTWIGSNRTLLRTAWKRRGIPLKSGMSIEPPAGIASSRAVCVIRTALVSSRRAAHYAAVNEHDELGPDLVPDYLTSLKDGAFYGWPNSYYGLQIDSIAPERPDQLSLPITL
jgi:hypothetical protein